MKTYKKTIVMNISGSIICQLHQLLLPCPGAPALRSNIQVQDGQCSQPQRYWIDTFYYMIKTAQLKLYMKTEMVPF